MLWLQLRGQPTNQIAQKRLKITISPLGRTNGWWSRICSKYLSTTKNICALSSNIWFTRMGWTLPMNWARSAVAIFTTGCSSVIYSSTRNWHTKVKRNRIPWQTKGLTRKNPKLKVHNLWPRTSWKSRLRIWWTSAISRLISTIYCFFSRSMISQREWRTVVTSFNWNRNSSISTRQTTSPRKWCRSVLTLQRTLVWEWTSVQRGLPPLSHLNSGSRHLPSIGIWRRKKNVRNICRWH